MSNEVAVVTAQLSKRFGQRVAVDALDLHIPCGTVYGLVGPNGAGKTTTIGMLLGLIAPSSGAARIFGHDVQRATAQALRSVGAMIEAPAFYPYLSAYNNLRVLASTRGLTTARIDTVLTLVELSTRKRDRFSTFSQGMKQRLALAAALLADPQLIILDEPTNGLDPAGTVEMRKLVQQLAAGGRTIVLCSHQLHEVEQLCERVAILHSGRLVAEGRIADLVQQRHVIEVDVLEGIEQAQTLLATIAWVRSVERDAMRLRVYAPPERAAEINRVLTSAGVAVAAIGLAESSLESVFLELTK
ncbi:ABC transporter ATP-binding protein [Candidatus Gracilibacteria bacterium]|nr:ABC transporter ATP-binding protein [Candidatus Gracilibacteria bacterium]